MSNELPKRIISSLILLPLVFFLIIKGSLYFDFLILISFLISLYEWHMMSRKKIYYFIGFIFLIFSFISVYFLRNNFPGEYSYFLFVILICICTDIGGYLFGKIIKGPKLTKISPNKTYSGIVGGYLFPVIILFFSIYNLEIFNHIYLNIKENSLFLNNLVFVLIISTVSQLGDIIISYFKRLSKIKDTGKIIPGHGGILDRIDGMIFAFPFAYIILSLNIFKYF